MAKINKFLIRDHELDERSKHNLLLLRKRIFLGGLGWIAFGIVGFYLFEHTSIMPLVVIVLFIGWLILTGLTIKYMALFKDKTK